MYMYLNESCLIQEHTDITATIGNTSLRREIQIMDRRALLISKVRLNMSVNNYLTIHNSYALYEC